MDASERPKARRSSLLGDNHSLTRLLLHSTGMLCLLVCYIVYWCWYQPIKLSYCLCRAHLNMIYDWPPAWLCFPWHEFGWHVSMHLDRQVRSGLRLLCHFCLSFSSGGSSWKSVFLFCHISYKSTSPTCPMVQALTDDSPHHKRSDRGHGMLSWSSFGGSVFISW